MKQRSRTFKDFNEERQETARNLITEADEDRIQEEKFLRFKTSIEELDAPTEPAPKKLRSVKLESELGQSPSENLATNGAENFTKDDKDETQGKKFKKLQQKTEEMFMNS